MGQSEGQTGQLWNAFVVKNKILNVFEKRHFKMSSFLLNKREVFHINFLCFLFLFLGEKMTKKNCCLLYFFTLKIPAAFATLTLFQIVQYIGQVILFKAK